MKQSIQYLGHVVDAQRLHTSPDKVKAIKEAPRPTIWQRTVKSILRLSELLW